VGKTRLANEQKHTGKKRKNENPDEPIVDGGLVDQEGQKGIQKGKKRRIKRKKRGRENKKYRGGKGKNPGRGDNGGENQLSRRGTNENRMGMKDWDRVT